MTAKYGVPCPECGWDGTTIEDGVTTESRLAAALVENERLRERTTLVSEMWAAAVAEGGSPASRMSSALAVAEKRIRADALREAIEVVRSLYASELTRRPGYHYLPMSNQVVQAIERLANQDPP